MTREAALHPARALAALAVLAIASVACDGTKDVVPPHWETLESFPGPVRLYTGVGAAGGQLFVVGGFNKSTTDPTKAVVFDTVTAYDTAAGAWATVAPLPSPIAAPNVAGVGNKLYVLGGLDKKESFAYDVATKIWTARAPMPVTRGHGVAAVGVAGTKILLAGGAVPGQSANMLNTGMRVRDFLAYDTATDTWEQLPELSLARGYGMGAVVGNRFWIIGGSSDFARTDEVVSFDLKARTWTDGPPPPLTLSSAGSATLGGLIYVLGGIATSSGMIGQQTLVLDTATGQWNTIEPMKVPRFATGAAVINGRIYVPGGIALVNAPDDYQPVATLEVYIP